MDEQRPGHPSGEVDPALDDPLERDAQELRQMIDAGASTPEELRALAERIRTHKALEQARWRNDVKPELLAGKRLRNRRVAPAAAPSADPSDLVDDLEQDRTARRNLKVGAALLGAGLLLLLLATQSGPAFVLVPLFGVLGYAYWKGRDPDTGDPGPADPPA